MALLSATQLGWEPETRTVRVTAYCPCTKCTHGLGLTRTGKSAWTEGVAVDPRIIPLGSRIDIPGYGNWVEADDTGGKIRGNRLDVRVSTHQEAVDWGVQHIKVRVWRR